jgi:uncharacterized Zn-finger protein
MNEDEGSFFLIPSTPQTANTDGTNEAKICFEKVDSPQSSYVQHLLNEAPKNNGSAEKPPNLCQTPPSAHQSTLADGSVRVPDNLNDDSILNDATRAQGSAGDQWIHGQLDDYMAYQGLNFTNGALAEESLPSEGVNQKAEPGKSASSVVCQLCGKLYSNKAHLMRHMTSHTNLRPYKCDICHLAFRNTSRLKRHKETHSGIKPYKCPLCEIKVSRKEHLKRHLIVHMDVRPYKCSLCQFTGRRIDVMKQHIRKSHLEGLTSVTPLHLGPSVVQNLLGQLQSSNSQSINLAALAGLQQASNQPTSSSKKKKKKVPNGAANTDGLPTVEPLTAQSQQQDEVLSLILSNVTPVDGSLPCDMCNKTFSDQAKLNRHKFSHLAVKPFSCDVCGARLSRQDHLKRHMYMHESTHPLICGTCRYATNKLSDLRAHIKSQHPGERIRILSSMANNRGETNDNAGSSTDTNGNRREDQMVADGSNNAGLPQGESIYSAGTWCASNADSSSSSDDSTSQQAMSKRKRKNPQKRQANVEGTGKVADAGTPTASEQSLRVPLAPNASLMVPPYSLMHNAAQYNLAAAGQAWKQPNTLTNLGMAYMPQANGSGASLTGNRGSRDGVMDLRQLGQFETSQESNGKHGHFSGGPKPVKNDKVAEAGALVDNRRVPPFVSGNMLSSRLLSDPSLRSNLPRVNEVWGPHFVDKTGWLRMPNAQGFTAPFFNNGMPNFVFNWPLQQGLPAGIASAAKASNNAVDKPDSGSVGRSSDNAIVPGAGVYNTYDIADLGGQPGFFSQGWPAGMNPY